MIRTNREWWIHRHTTRCFICLCPFLFRPSKRGFAPTDLSLPFFFSFPSVFSNNLISFTWRLFLPAFLISTSLFSLLASSPVCWVYYLLCPCASLTFGLSFVWWTLLLTLVFVRWLRQTRSSDRLQASKTASQNVFLHFWWFNVLRVTVKSFILTALDKKSLSSKDSSKISQLFFLFFFFFMLPLRT